MLKLLKSTALSLAIGLGAIAGTPALAQADSLYLGIDDDDFGIELRSGYSHRRDPRRYEYRRYDDDRGYRRCSAERAARKAQRLGLNRVRVVDVDRRTITVRGRSFGDRVRVTFGRAPNCPVIASW